MSTQATLASRWTAGWNRCFFSEEAPFGLALVRILLPWVLVIDGLFRWPHVRELYSTDGAPAPLALNFGYPGFLPEFSGPVAVALHTAMLFFLVTASLGWCTRLSLVGGTLLYFYFGYLDVVSTLTKYTCIATHLLLLLSLSSCGEVWSVDAWLRRSRSLRLGLRLSPPRAAIWPQRLIQVLLAMVYFGAAITKLHTPSFFSGDQLMYWMITYINNEHPVGDLLAQFPVVLVLCCYTTLIWELVFSVVVWQKWGRVPTLVIGAGFHVMTALTLGLYIFPMVMIVSYAGFLTEQDVLALRRAFRRWSWFSRFAGSASAFVRGFALPAPRLRWAATAGFALALTLVTLGGVQAEQMMDVYHLGRGKLPLREVPAAEVARLMQERPLREVDKFLSLDIGTTVVGEHLIDRGATVRQGQIAVVQVTLLPPHEDLWVECLLRAPDGALVSRLADIIPREVFRYQFRYKLDGALAPGVYSVHIRSGNQDVLKKELTLLAADGTEPSPPAVKDAVEVDSLLETTEFPPQAEPLEP